MRNKVEKGALVSQNGRKNLLHSNCNIHRSEDKWPEWKKKGEIIDKLQWPPPSRNNSKPKVPSVGRINQNDASTCQRKNLAKKNFPNFGE